MTTHPSLVRQVLDELKHLPKQNVALPSGHPLIDEEKHLVLMHRDAHFGGLFSEMVEYYAHEGKGALLEPQTVRSLAQLQDQVGQDLSPLVLTSLEATLVAQAQHTYQKLRTICEIETPVQKTPRLIAELILAEEEEEAGAIEAVVEGGETVIPELLALLGSQEFLNPLFPGYGYAPGLAATCLGRLQAKQAIVPLFEMLGNADPGIEQDAISALRQIGDPAYTFLIARLEHRPLDRDNERSAMALGAFPPSEHLGQIALRQLEDGKVLNHPMLVAYLGVLCEGLQAKKDVQRFHAVATRADLSEAVSEQLQGILRTQD